MYRCGTDIVKIERIQKLIKEKDMFIEKVFSHDEIEYCTVKSDKQTSLHFAGRFAAKEAIYKAISESSIVVKSWKDIEIINKEKKMSKPYVKINGEIIKNIDLSISHEEEYAIAMAIFEE